MASARADSLILNCSSATALPSMDQLLEPVSESKPTGDNLEYHPDFAELERAARGRPARQMGSAIAPGEPPNFQRVLELASGLLQRSKDLRIGVQLARALLETDGFAGLARGLRLVRGLLERYWDSLYPELDPDDRDAMMRRSALSALSAPELLAAVRVTPLLESARSGSIKLRDVASVTGEPLQSGNSPELDADAIAGSFRAAEPSALRALLDEARAARTHLNAIEAAVAASTGTAALDLSPLGRILDQVSASVRPYLEPREAAAATVGPEPVATPTEPPAASPEGSGSRPALAFHSSGAIRGREDVIHWLDQIAEYYVQHEPSSPLPLLLQRCRRLAATSFLDAIRELAPDALSQIQMVTGVAEK